MDNNWEKLQLEDRKNVFSWCLDFIQALFPVLLFTYLLLVLVENLFKGSVSLYFNLNYLLISVIGVGTAAVLGIPVNLSNDNPGRLTKKCKLVITCAVIATVVITRQKIGNLGWISYIISILSGGIIAFLAAFAWQRDEGEEVDEEDSQDN